MAMWKSIEIPQLSRKSLSLLVDNRLAAVRIRDFASTSELDLLKRGLIENNRLSSSIRQVTRFGISQYEEGLKHNKQNYFSLTQRAAQEQKNIFAGSFDPVERFITLLEVHVENTGIMEEPGYGRYYAGNGKMRQGFSPIHVDFAPQDSAGWAIGGSQNQLAWNLYIDIPQQGGELLIWDKQWQPADDIFQVDGNYYYDEAVVAGQNRLSIKPQRGEILLINTRNFHAVADSDNRFAFGSFIACLGEGSMMLWS